MGLEAGGDAWFREIAELTGDVFFVMRTEPDQALEFISETSLGHTGYSAEEYLADPGLYLRIAHAKDTDRLGTALSLEPGDTDHFEVGWRRRDGESMWTEMTLRSRLRADGSVVVEGVSHDITERHRAEAALAASEELHRLLVENAWDVIWTMDLDGSVTYVSPAIERVRGITPEEAMTQTLDQIHPAESQQRVLEYYGRLFAAIEAGEPPPSFFGEQEYYRKDGSIMVGELQVIPQVDATGRVVKILGVTRDVTDRKALEEELSRRAMTDPVTGAWNRQHGEELVRRDHADRAADHPVSLLMIDIDFFKSVNDSYGHEVGDRVLSEVTDRLRECLRTSDILSRWGGEEFVVLLDGCTVEQAATVAEALRSAVSSAPIAQADIVTVSIGVAQVREGEDLMVWIDRADQAMYGAKRSGRDAVVVAP